MTDNGGWAPPPQQRASVAARAGRFLHRHPTRRAGWNWGIWATVVLLVLGVLGNAAGGARHRATAEAMPAAVAASSPLLPTEPATPAAAAVTGAPTRVATPRTKPRPRPATTAGIVVTSAGAVLPNAYRTPGVINPVVTQTTIHSTICVPGWTSTVRPPSSYTTELKIQQLATGYAYQRDLNPGDYEEDHLISLELGGSPTAAANLWPEPYFATDGARTKDRIENRLHSLVCSGLISLATAQQAIARNWWVAYTTYQATAPAPPRSSTVRTTTAPAPVADPGDGATAQCNDGSYSYAAHHQGACSHHGGVKIFYK